jgi:hypothetical protein
MTYAESYDVLTNSRERLEVKYSKVHANKSRRWSWQRVLGFQDRRGDYDFLVLAGEKDPLFTYVDSMEFVYFIVPRSAVSDLTSKGEINGSQITLNTNFETRRRVGKSEILKQYIVDSPERFQRFATGVIP